MGLVARVKTTGVFVAFLQHSIDTPGYEQHKGTEAGSQSKDVVVHDTVNQLHRGAQNKQRHQDECRACPEYSCGKQQQGQRACGQA